MSVIVNGVEYENIKVYCESKGIKDNSVYVYAKRNNLPIIKVLEMHDKGLLTFGDFVFRGVKYPSFKNCCESFGLALNTVIYYSKVHNVSKQEAMEYYLSPEYIKRHKANTVFRFRDVNYPSYSSCIKTLGFNYSTVRAYAKRHNLSKQEVLEHYLKNGVGRGKPLLFKEKMYKSLRSCCKEYGIDENRVYQYFISHNVSRQEALEHYINKKNS